MATQYSHPFEGIETTTDLAEAFRNKFELENTEATDESVTVPLKDNWDADAVNDLVEATPFAVLGYDEDEATVVFESELTDE